jgi:hypothetical protein
MIVCFQFRSKCLAGPCGRCGKGLDFPHVVGTEIFCEDCCPACNPVILWRSGQPVVGVQGGLF